MRNFRVNSEKEKGVNYDFTIFKKKEGVFSIVLITTMVNPTDKQYELFFEKIKEMYLDSNFSLDVYKRVEKIDGSNIYKQLERNLIL